MGQMINEDYFSFVALETYFRGNGVRMDVVRNLNVRDIISATPVLTKCPYCLSMVTWKDHKDNCRKKSLADGVPDHKVTTKNLAIKIRNHKTGNIFGIGKCNV